MSISTNIHGVKTVLSEVRVYTDDFTSLSFEATTRYGDTAKINYFLPFAMAAKAKRIADAFNEIMAEDDSADQPLLEAIADTFTPLGEAAASVVAGLTPEADGVEPLAAE